ncbi:MAG: hypothetical protein JSV80_09450 [Acidobacteriota bacterium]|nr:MAG: hypothetical protein JSV80_09450 [Acidobacteriota bacterium]
MNTARQWSGSPLSLAVWGLVVELTHRVLNRDMVVPLNYAWITGAPWVAKRHGFRLIKPPEGNVNHPAFVEQIRLELQPSFALVFGSLQIFKPPLIASIERIVNYHNGLVPHYRGLSATGWSLYRGEERTGFTFHDMVAGIDKGPIVLQGSVPVLPGVSVRRHDYYKTALAAASIPAVLAHLVDGESPTPQESSGSYFSAAARTAITTVEEPRSHSEAELRRRLQAFGTLSISLEGGSLPVTSLRSVPSTASRLCFRTADGSQLQATRLAYLPPRVYSAVRSLRRWIPSWP